MDRFQYQPLTSADAFRLVVLQPGHGDDIHCRLLYTTHSNKPNYEALSYTWGGIDRPRMLHINGMIMACGENLWQALKHLRSPEVERMLWVDAICIDQSNKCERTHQVSQMRAIYSHAVTVLIWLGPETESSGIAMEWIKELSMRKRGSLGPQERLSGLSAAQIRNRQTQRWQALSELCRREYWRRVWIVQEVILARRIIIHYGESEARWLGLENLINGYDAIFTPVTVQKAAQQVKESIPAQLHSLRIMHKLKGCTLNKLLETTRDSLCTDPRDKVYALVGLAVECRNGQFVADYSKSLDKVYND